MSILRPPVDTHSDTHSHLPKLILTLPTHSRIPHVYTTHTTHTHITTHTNKRGGHNPPVTGSVSVRVEAWPSAGLLSRRSGCVFFPSHSSITASHCEGGFVGLCFLLPGQSQVEPPPRRGLRAATSSRHGAEAVGPAACLSFPAGCKSAEAGVVLLCVAATTDLREGNLLVNLDCSSRPRPASKPEPETDILCLVFHKRIKKKLQGNIFSKLKMNEGLNTLTSWSTAAWSANYSTHLKVLCVCVCWTTTSECTTIYFP